MFTAATSLIFQDTIFSSIKLPSLTTYLDWLSVNQMLERKKKKDTVLVLKELTV